MPPTSANGSDDAQLHPHVHVVVKALSEQGKRLSIKKPMLQNWRGKFAEQLRADRSRSQCDARRAKLARPKLQQSRQNL